MILFASIPDDHKHEAAEAYFATGTIPEKLRPGRLLNEIDDLNTDDEPENTAETKEASCG